MNQSTDYYKILQVQFGAQKADIVSSYRRLCKLYHPDINRTPGAEELMKQINLAYYTLCDDRRRQEYDHACTQKTAGNYAAGAEKGSNWAKEQKEADDKRAYGAIHNYFAAFCAGAYEKAYHLLCNYDKQYVTMQSFCKWRKAVDRLFSMREFSVKAGEFIPKMTLEDGRTVLAKKFYISFTEKNIATQETSHHQIAKVAVLESGMWRVFLGYRDLNEIAKMFEQLSVEQEKGEMAKHWEQYCENTYRSLNMLSLSGLLKVGEKEIYRCGRYKQAMTIACLQIQRGAIGQKQERMADVLEVAARSITSSLRETDIPAYIGDGVFVILFVELKKRNAAAITQRLANKLKKNVEDSLKTNVFVACEFSPYMGGALKSCIEQLTKKFVK